MMSVNPRHDTHSRTDCAKSEMVYELSADLRCELRLDLRFLLRDLGRARSLRLLRALLKTIEHAPTRIRFPLEVLESLAAEIDHVAGILPDRSPLLDLGRRARERIVKADDSERGMAASRIPNLQDGEWMSVRRSFVEEARFLVQAAAAVEVSDVPTTELGDKELAGWMRCCMARSDYGTVVGVLEPYVHGTPRMWAWKMLLTALRKSGNAGFNDAASRFFAWVESTYPQAIEKGTDRVDGRRMSRGFLDAIESRELEDGPSRDESRERVESPCG